MKFEEVKKSVMSAVKGSFHGIRWSRECKVKKAYANMNVQKVCSAVVRFGVDYDKMQSTRDGRADGTLPAENAGLPWGTWETFPYFIYHKGNRYLRCTLGANNAIKVQYYLNGLPVEKTAIEHMLLASEKTSSHDSVFSVRTENIIEIK